MTAKRKRIYEIIIFSLVIVLTSLCAYMGITAIQKQMKLNMSFQMNPSIYVKVEIYNTSTSKYETIFQNTNETEIKSGVILSGNTLQFANDYATTLGTSLKMKVTSLNEGITMLTEFSGASVTSGGNTITATATTYNVASDELTVSTLSNLTIQFSQAFSITETVSNADITSYTNAYKIDGVYYAKAGETPTFTFTSEDYYTNPPAGLTAEGTAYSYAGGIMTLTEISGNATIKGEASASSYTITYDTDGGSAVSAQNYTYKADTITLAAAPTKANYDFNGWKVSATVGSWIEGATYTAGQTITADMHGDVTLVAQWKAKAYILTYNANPVSTYADNDITPPTQGSMNTSEYQQGESKALTTNGFTMPKGAYNSAGTFLGWSEDPNATKATYTDGQSITISQDTTLYAVWDYVWTIKAYNQTNVTTGYNSNFAGYYYVEMGEYPQTYVASVSGAPANPTSGTPHTDANGDRYYFQNRMPYYNSSGKTETYYTDHESGWYKFEPIKWLIIGAGSNMAGTYGTGATLKTSTAYPNGEVGTNQLLLISELTLYATQFDHTNYTGDSSTGNNRYYTGTSATTSDIYYSINGGFGSRDGNYGNDPDAAHIKTGFASISGLSSYYDDNDGNNDYINQTTIATTTYRSDGSAKNQADGTSHYIFPMGGYSGDSYYVSTYLTSTGMRKAYSSDFAKATSVYKSTSSSTLNYSYWWLRSGFSSLASYAYYVNYDGSVDFNFVDYSDRGVRPSFVLNLA